MHKRSLLSYATTGMIQSCLLLDVSSAASRRLQAGTVVHVALVAMPGVLHAPGAMHVPACHANASWGCLHPVVHLPAFNANAIILAASARFVKVAQTAAEW